MFPSHEDWVTPAHVTEVANVHLNSVISSVELRLEVVKHDEMPMTGATYRGTVIEVYHLLTSGERKATGPVKWEVLSSPIEITGSCQQ